ncbi:MAG: dihydroorotate dehydrogenase-like protein [Actinomycetota bacterium]
MDLSTTYLGLPLATPLVAAASPLNGDVGNIRRLEDCRAGAVVLPSIFQEEIEDEIEAIESMLAETGAEAGSYFPAAMAERTGPDGYLELVRRARAAVDIPVIASLNGTCRTGWTDYARRLEQAGASAIELNIFYLPTDLAMGGDEVEQRHLDVLAAVKAEVSIPVSVKLSPYFSSVGHLVRRLDDAGADGFVLFNRFYQPDIDMAELKLVRDVRLSHRGEIRLPLLWIGALYGKVSGSLAASTGVQTAREVVKYLLVGADVVTTASALLRHGPGHMKTLVDGLEEELKLREMDNVAAIRGCMSRNAVADRTAFDRANYIGIIRRGAVAVEAE